MGVNKDKLPVKYLFSNKSLFCITRISFSLRSHGCHIDEIDLATLSLGDIRQTDTTALHPVISKNRWWTKLPHLCNSLIIKYDRHKKRIYWSKHILQGACPCLPPATVLRHVVVQRPYREHVLAYPQPQF